MNNFKATLPTHVVAKKMDKAYKVPFDQWLKFLHPFGIGSVNDTAAFITYPETDYTNVPIESSTCRFVDTTNWSTHNFEIECAICESMTGDKTASGILKVIEEQLYGTSNPSVIAVAMIMNESRNEIVKAVSDKMEEIYREHGITVINEIKTLFGGKDGNE
ncbi:MAG: hypothetical protein GY938_13220 [Ketobacter sp.]|nr:hypothetical protein [Ketobacter sp.]